MDINRRQTREVAVGSLVIGGTAPVSVQSMTNTNPRDAAVTLAQISRLAGCGCELVRVAVPDSAAAETLAEIVRDSPLPVVADIHFDYRLALAALDAGVHKLRLNPGNIGTPARVKRVVAEAKRRRVPIRIGVNSGSIEKDILHKHGHPTPEAMVESVMRHVTLLEELDFTDIVISLKASDVPVMVAAYRQISRQVGYPLHLGVTEAGAGLAGVVTSAAGIGALLVDGIGDTIRVSLTAPPEDEVDTGYAILEALGLRQRGPRFISCPTCGRTSIDLIAVAGKVREALRDVTAPVKIAVMGCEVNGPGEAAEADIGLAGGARSSLIFHKGRIIRKIPNENLAETFIEAVREFLQNNEG